MNQSGTDGDQGGGKAQPRPVAIDLRSFQEDSQEGTYQLVARSPDGHDGAILVDAVTEEGHPISCPLAAAWDEAGKPLTVEGNRITGIPLQAGQPARLKIQLKQAARVALRASTL
ncbi:MAG TPA: hypothetical protein P5205_22110 [Candidatus Paceibacterota bacterium]|nr:hypothetical protein [Verrucomicrobiota bacterium]HSA13055.1 hypothetical protein [Candidatus Paceibacterota bacterium]